eukprot:scaffold1411_cov396-Prasinococcus_capsulatus_cf.AAC.25
MLTAAVPAHEPAAKTNFYLATRRLRSISRHLHCMMIINDVRSGLRPHIFPPVSHKDRLARSDRDLALLSWMAREAACHGLRYSRGRSVATVAS